MLNLNRFIEHTALKPTLTDKDIDRLVEEAKEHEFLGICVPTFWVKKASRDIKGHGIQLVTVVGFPLGYQMTENKLDEIKLAIATEFHIANIQRRAVQKRLVFKSVRRARRFGVSDQNPAVLPVGHEQRLAVLRGELAVRAKHHPSRRAHADGHRPGSRRGHLRPPP